MESVPAVRAGVGEVESVVAALARLHSVGVAVDLPAAIGGGRAIDLPTYSFQRERFWLESAPGGDVHGAGLTAPGHPMLGAVVVLPEQGGAVATGKWSARTLPWLTEHVVSGAVVVPGTALVEVIGRAGDEVGAGVVEELVIEAPVVLPAGGVRVQVVIGAVDADGRRSAAVYASGDEGLSWTRHASGFVGGAEAAVEVGTSAEWPPSGAVVVEVDGFYAERARDGIGYGPVFQGLRRAWTRDGEVFAEVALPEDTDTDGYVLHPALLDAALQTGMLLPQFDGHEGTLLPFSLTGVRVLASGARTVRVRAVAAGPGACAVTLADAAGDGVAAVGGLTLRPLSAGALDEAGALAREALLRVEWVPVDRPSDPDVTTVRVCGPADLGALTAHIDAGATVPDVVLLDLAAAPDGSAHPVVGGAGQRAPERVRELLADALATVQSWLAEPRYAAAELVVLTRGAVDTGDSAGTGDPAAAAVWGLLRAAQSENPGQFVLLDVDQDNDPSMASVAVATGEPQLAVRSGQLSAPRLAPASAGLAVPAGDAGWHLDITSPGTVENLALVTGPTATAPLEPGQVRVAIRAAGVNFRDVMITLGMYPGDAAVGGEGAGVVVEIGSDVTGLRPGDRVMGLFEHAFGPVAVADHRHVVAMPAGWTFAQAASAPIVFLTAYYGLRDLAGAGTPGSGRSLLVHAAAGGVGMAATQLARHFGFEVYGSASRGKWPMLRAAGFDDDHIVDSRALGFADRILTATAGAGVDVVLNSLAGDFIDESLRLLPRGGSFLEMGKTDIREAGAVVAAYPGVRYLPFDLVDAGPDRIHELLTDLAELFTQGVLTPLPITAWDIRRAPEAFRHLSQARHIGKVVLMLPRPIDPRGTVLISGAGSLGALTARHLVARHGVRNLLLLSRRGRAADGIAALEADLVAAGARLTVAACDLTDRRQVTAALAAIPAEHPLTAVVHTAGVLDDGMLAGLDDDRIDTVLRPKVDAAVLLGELTADADLAAFVLFSSAAGVLGNPGQGNYAAANAFLDAYARQRRTAGLPATSLAWGFWAHDSEMTAHLDSAARARTRRDGMLGLTAELGTALFDAGVAAPDAALVPVRLDLAALRDRSGKDPVPALLRGLVRPRRRSVAAPRAGTGSLARELAALPAADREAFLVDLVREHSATVLGHASAGRIGASQAFRDAGFDSLTAVELRNRLVAATGVRVPATVTFDHPSPLALARHLLDELLGSAPDAPVAAPAAAASEEPVAIVAMACRLPGGVVSPEGLWDVVSGG
ncbi:SDR family NAD(P)-dependent oxidoreductase, partial [Actinoplanes sp. NPDC048967]|uniref:SDR family NAD(P)-dependent oxidoreductase n=1 Tax=Actinoplanes sp. NPDC048967 TaxID=3155269 RepID=UPI0033E320BA